MTEIRIPAVGESIGEVEIGAWLKNEGDTVAKDENLVVIESDKATLELASPASGVVAQIRRRAGESVAIGEVIGVIEPGNEGEKRKEEKRTVSQSEEEKKSEKGTVPESAVGLSPKAPRPIVTGAITDDLGEGNGAEAARGNGSTARAEKSEKRTESEKGTVPGWEGLSPQSEKATVPRSEGGLSPGGTGPLRRERAVPLSPLRRAVARRLVQAKQQAALLTTFNEIDMSAVRTVREQERARFEEKHGARLGYMSFFVKAAVAALELVPQLNSELRDDTLVYHEAINIGIAVGSGKGLVVPVLRGADKLGFAAIEKQIADFVRRAEENRLKPEDFEDGTFTISNGGIYGSLLSTPIVNPPQSGILGMHAIIDRPIASGGAVVIRPMMYVALTYDHRIIDGREAVQFLRRIKECIEAPIRLLLVD